MGRVGFGIDFWKVNRDLLFGLKGFLGGVFLVHLLPRTVFYDSRSCPAVAQPAVQVTVAVRF